MDNERINEIDVARFIAIVLMIIYHIVYDLSEYTDINVNINALVWEIVGKTAAFLFIFISGVCSGIGNDTVERGMYVFSWGMVTTFITYIFDENQYIRFGILHLLGFSMIISLLIRRLNTFLKFVIAASAVILGWTFNEITSNFIILLPLGITYKDFTSFDYYPIMPYISLFIMGIIFQEIFYKNKRSKFKIKSNYFIRYVSSNSLTLYILHQPVILLILRLLGGVRNG